jgi:hypothetical protein
MRCAVNHGGGKSVEIATGRRVKSQLAKFHAAENLRGLLACYVRPGFQCPFGVPILTGLISSATGTMIAPMMASDQNTSM